MNAPALIAELRRRGVTLEAQGDRLRFRPVSAVSEDLVARLREQKADVLARLLSSSSAGTPLADEPIVEARERLAAVLIRSRRFDREVWIALDPVTADELAAEEQRRPSPRPVLQPADIEALVGKPEEAVRAVLEIAAIFPGSRARQ